MAEKVSESEKIWEEIKDLTIEAYGLQNQKVHQFVKRVDVPGNELYVKIGAGAILPWLENALGSAFEVTLHEGFVSVKRNLDKTASVKKLLKSM